MSKRYYKKREEDDSELDKLFAGGLTLLLIYLVYLYRFDSDQFWYITSVYVLPITVLLLTFFIYKKKKKRNSIQQVLNDNNLNQVIQKFILSFGHDRSKTAWEYRGHKFEEKGLEEFADVLIQKGFRISKRKNADIKSILEQYIDKTDKKYLEESLETRTTRNYTELSNSGVEFEELIVRLYNGMGYESKRIGGTGDYGGDVLATKGGETVLIQAKFYENSVGIKAVQEALGAREKYNCNSAVVVTTGTFTREAVELAKVTNIGLIDEERLRRMLVEFLHETWE